MSQALQLKRVGVREAQDSHPEELRRLRVSSKVLQNNAISFKIWRLLCQTLLNGRVAWLMRYGLCPVTVVVLGGMLIENSRRSKRMVHLPMAFKVIDLWLDQIKTGLTHVRQSSNWLKSSKRNPKSFSLLGSYLNVIHFSVTGEASSLA